MSTVYSPIAFRSVIIARNVDVICNCSDFMLWLLQAENMIVHKDEIFSRPKKSWFQSENDKKKVVHAAKVISFVLSTLFVYSYTIFFYFLFTGDSF